MFAGPFLVPLAALVAGILLGFHLKGPLWALLPIGLSLAYSVFLNSKLKMPYQAIVHNKRHFLWIAGVFLGIGILTAWFHRPMELPPGRLDHWNLLRGQVQQTASFASGDRLVVDVTYLADENGNVEHCRNLRIVLATTGLSANRGDIVQASGLLVPISENGNYRPNGYPERMIRQGILYSMRADDQHVKVLGSSNSVTAKSAAIRDHLVSLLEHSSLGRPTVGFLSALLFGDKTMFAPGVRDKFSNAGLAHVLALSGMHAGIIMGVFLFLLFPLKMAGLHKLRLWIAVALLWGYVWLSGLAPSTVRAAVMITFVTGGLSLQRKNAASNALMASAFAIILFDPYALYNAGMQLSFVCVASILGFASSLNSVNKKNHSFLHTLNSALLVSLTATLATWVIVSYYFKVIPLLFLPANLLLLPLIPVYMVLAMVYLALLTVGIDFGFLASLLDWAYLQTLHATDFLSAHGAATITCQVQFPVVLLWLAGVMVIGLALRKRKKSGVWAGAAVLATAIGLVPVLQVKQKEGLIVQRQFSELALTLYDEAGEWVKVLPRNTVSRLVHKNGEIVSLDCQVDVDSLLGQLAKSRKAGRRRLLLVGSNAGHPNVDRLVRSGGFEKIILHSSLRRRMEDEILSAVPEEFVEQVHSLHDEGPFTLDFNETAP